MKIIHHDLRLYLNNNKPLIFLACIINILFLVNLQIPAKHFEIFLNLNLISNFLFENSNEFNLIKTNSNWYSLFLLFSSFKITKFFFLLSNETSFKILIFFLINIYIVFSIRLLEIINNKLKLNLSNIDILFVFIFVFLNNYLFYSLNDIETAFIFAWPLFCILTINFITNSKFKDFILIIFFLIFFTPPNLAYGALYLVLYFACYIFFSEKKIFNKKFLFSFSSITLLLLFFYHQNFLLVFNPSTSLEFFREDFYTNSKFNNYINILNFTSNNDFHNLQDNFTYFLSGRMNFFSKLILFSNFFIIVYFVFNEKNKILKYFIILTVLFISSTNYTNIIYPVFKFFLNENFFTLIFRNTYKLNSLLIFFLALLIAININKKEFIKKIIQFLCLVKILVLILLYPSFLKKNNVMFIEKIPNYHYDFAEYIKKNVHKDKIFLKQPSQYHYYFNWGSYTFENIINSENIVIKNGASNIKFKLPLYLIDYKSDTFSSRLPPENLENLENLFCNYLNFLNIEYLYLLKDVDYQLYNLNSFKNHKYLYDNLKCLKHERNFSNQILLYKVKKISSSKVLKHKIFLYEDFNEIFMFDDKNIYLKDLVNIYNYSNFNNKNEYDLDNFESKFLQSQNISYTKKINPIIQTAIINENTKLIINKEFNRKKLIIDSQYEIIKQESIKTYKLNEVFDAYIIQSNKNLDRIYLIDIFNFFALVFLILISTLNIIFIYLNFKILEND